MCQLPTDVYRLYTLLGIQYRALGGSCLGAWTLTRSGVEGESLLGNIECKSIYTAADGKSPRAFKSPVNEYIAYIQQRGAGVSNTTVLYCTSSRGEPRL